VIKPEEITMEYVKFLFYLSEKQLQAHLEKYPLTDAEKVTCKLMLQDLMTELPEGEVGRLSNEVWYTDKQ
jgi:hypothetical protein